MLSNLNRLIRQIPSNRITPHLVRFFNNINGASKGSHAVISTFDMFSIGIGPSSSHTVGPMRASKKFVDSLSNKNLLGSVTNVRCELYGSLALTGVGHGTDFAVVMGLTGETPELIDPKTIPSKINIITKSHRLKLRDEHEINFEPIHDLLWYKDQELPYHPNGIKYIAFNEDKNILFQQDYYSVGGGFVVTGDPTIDIAQDESPDLKQYDENPPYPFESGAELLRLARALDCNISEIGMKNELHWRSEQEIRSKLLNIWNVMDGSIKNGISTKGLLQTQIKRRAANMYEKLINVEVNNGNNPLNSIVGTHLGDWLYCWAMAVNEENAAGGKVVTAPTNGASGVIPAVIKYYETFHKNATEQGICDMLLTAATIGMLFKKGASLSAAEVGCQGEVGVASSMAAAALCEVMGGNIYQVANAAEIAMQHSLGLTCDPIGGFVEVPCIERNALAAKRAVNAARLALYGDGKDIVSLDAVIKAMKETGIDMQNRYKETSLGGLAMVCCPLR